MTVRGMTFAQAQERTVRVPAFPLAALTIALSLALFGCAASPPRAEDRTMLEAWGPCHRPQTSINILCLEARQPR